MKAAILTQLNAPLVVDNLDLPALQHGQVLVRVLCATICGAQIGEIAGAKGEDKHLPHLLGHEGCGIVEDVGPGVRHVKPGDKVVMHWRKGIGIEAEPPKYGWNGKTVGGGWVTTFNDQAVISENRLTPVSHDTPAWFASLLGCAVTTGFGLVNNEARLRIGESIAISGCGGVGLSVIKAASLVSAYPIIAIDRLPAKLDLAHYMGATHGIAANGSSVANELRNLVGTRGVDVFVECTGSPDVIDIGLAATAAGGRLILVGQPPAKAHVTFHNFRQNYCGKTMIDSQGGLTNPTVDIPRYIMLYKTGALDSLEMLITQRCSLDRINDAVEIVKGGPAGRVMLEMSDG
jgi:Zn-dependent alcohol dehydrogenase